MPLPNLIREMDALRNALSIESCLRDAATEEFAAGLHDGPMRVAHDVICQRVADLVKVVADKVAAAG